MNSKTLLKLFLIAFSIKVLIVPVVLMAAHLGLFTLKGQGMNYYTSNWWNVLEFYFNSDSGWYKVIAEHGYQNVPLFEKNGWSQAQQHFAFFPLYPLCIKALMVITGTSFYVSAFFFSLITLGGLISICFYFLIQSGYTAEASYKITVLLLLFPFSLHLYFIYTESLFLTLVLASFLFIARKHMFGLAVCAGLLTLTRPNGIVLILPFFIYMMEQDGKISISNLKKAIFNQRYYVLLIMPLCFFLYQIYQHRVTGNYFAFAEAQSAWKKQWMFPLLALFRNGFWQEQFTSWYCIAMIVLAFVWAKRWSFSFNVLVWIGLLMPLAAGSVISMPRYLSVLFPFHFRAGNSVFFKKYFRILVLILMILQLICLKLWIEDDSLMY